MEPSIGRIVHYYIAGVNQPRPAIITDINAFGGLFLAVFDRANTFYVDDIHQESDAGKGWWTWPPRT